MKRLEIQQRIIDSIAGIDTADTIEAMQQALKDLQGQCIYWKDFGQIARANAEADEHWFDRANMRMFGTVIQKGIYKGRYFITAEPYPSLQRHLIERFTIRKANQDGTIETVGQYQQFEDLELARFYIRMYLN